MPLLSDFDKMNSEKLVFKISFQAVHSSITIDLLKEISFKVYL
jgi:hypothetical protein